jgi:hypothetical protein
LGARFARSFECITTRLPKYFSKAGQHILLRRGNNISDSWPHWTCAQFKLKFCWKKLFALVVTNIRGVHARNLATKRENLENFWKEMGPPSSPSTTGSPCSKSKVGISSWWRESCHLKYIKEGGFAPPTTCSHLGFATGTSSGGGTGWGPISTFSFPIVF